MPMPVVLLLILLMPGLALARCPPMPKLAPLAAERTQVDLVWELNQPWQAGGEIVLYCAPDGTPRAGRLTTQPSNAVEETARRREHFALARRLNFANKGEAHPLGLPLGQPQIELLQRFSMSDTGAVWFREVANDTLRQFNRGYLEYDLKLWRRALKTRQTPRLSKLLTGHMSETGLFAADASLFKFSGYAGPGAMAHPGAIGLGDAGLRCQFPASEELVDPHAIISHEFGHTRYGDPASSGTLLGEARTVERYENPVRVRNGYTPRTTYFQRQGAEEVTPAKDGLIERLLRLKTEHGISVTDQSTVDRHHCDCPGPLPIILDCDTGQRPLAESESATPNYDCQLNWRPVEPVLLPLGQKALQNLIQKQ